MVLVCGSSETGPKQMQNLVAGN